MDTATYHNLPLINGPQDFFKLAVGVAPSFGFFRAAKSLVDYVLTAQGGAPGTLALSDGAHTVTLYNIYLVKASSVPGMDEVYDIVLADERVLWQYTYGTADYNTYKTDRRIGTTEFALDNLNAGNEWTFTEVLNVLKSTLGIATLDFTPPTRKPRNIIGKNVVGTCIFKQLLQQMQSYVAIDVQVADPTYVVYPVGAEEQAGDLTEVNLYAGCLHKDSTVVLNPKTSRGLSVKMVSAANPDEAPGRLLTYGSKTATGGSGSHFVDSVYAVFGNELNATALGTIGNEVAQEYVDSFANVWRDATYAGILPFKLNRAVHEIIWSLTPLGAFTRIKSFRPKEEPPSVQDVLFSYFMYLLGAGASANVRSARIQTGGVPNNATGPFTCKLLDAEGNETGAAIEVYPREHLGTNNLNGDVHPAYAAGDDIPVYKDLDDEWYTMNVFEDTIECVCEAP